MADATDPKSLRPLPSEVADLALLDVNDVCNALRMSPSWVYEQVRTGRAPQPVVREPRCTRWRASDIRAWLIQRSSAALPGGDGPEPYMAPTESAEGEEAGSGHVAGSRKS